MVMSLADLRAIYELLFRDGVIVAKKDKRPQSMHPDIKAVSNLKVICAVGSLKSKGYVRETFAWKHVYYYLTNEGTVYLRNYLHLPSEIRPVTNKVDKDGVQNLTFNRKGKDFCRENVHQGKKGHKKHLGPSCRSAEERPARSFTSVMKTKLPASPVHNSPSVVPEIPKRVSTVQTAPSGPVMKVLQKCLKETVAEQSSDFEESESTQMQKTMIKVVTDKFILDVMGGKTFHPTLNGEVEPGQHVVVNQQTIPLLAKLTVMDEQQGVLEGDDVVIEDIVEKLAYDAEMMEQLNMTNSKTPESDCDHDLETHTDSFKDLTKDKVVDNDIADVEDTEKVLETTVLTKVISPETSSRATFEADCPIPVDSSECLIAAPKTTLLQGVLESLSEVPEKRQDLHRIWRDFQDGLNLSLFSPSVLLLSSCLQ